MTHFSHTCRWPTRFATALATLGLIATVAPQAAAQQADDQGPCVSRGDYITVGGDTSPYTDATGEVRSEAQLRYTLVCPDPAVAGPGPYPTVFIYSGYSHDPALQGAGRTPAEFNRKGYAVIGVAPRGTNCSSGTYDFGQPVEARDGYDVVEWIAGQAWSNKKVAMVGESYGAILQFPVAALRPPHLVAIAAQHPIADLYRDAVYPGGIFNLALAAAWGPFQQAQATAGSGSALSSDAAGATQRKAPGTNCTNQYNRHDPVTRFRAEAWDGDFYRDRVAYAGLSNIDVPVWTVVSWQDNVVGPRGAHMLSEIKDLHATVSNGAHDQGTTGKLVRDRDAFLDYYVKGSCLLQEEIPQVGWRERGPTFEDTCPDHVYAAPRVRVWWESNTSRDGGWRSSVGEWPALSVPLTYYLSGNGSSSGGGELNPVGPGKGSDSYTYLGGSGRSKSAETWGRGPGEGRSLTYTSPPLRRDVAMMGSASLDLWLAASDLDLDSLIDTDIQVTLSEVRLKQPSSPADGFGEVYVQQGWLRASHRKLDESRSTSTQPYHTHLKDDAVPMNEGEITGLRVEILPFGHVFRAGSRIRINIEAPKAVPDLWGFESTLGPMTNTLFHDTEHPSRLVLPVLATQPSIPGEVPPCGGLRAQPCRDVAAPDPTDASTQLSFTEASATGGDFSDQASVAALLTDSAGRTMAGAEVNFSVTGDGSDHQYRAVTDDRGIATISIPLRQLPGEYQLKAWYGGDITMQPSEAMVPFIVNKERTVTEVGWKRSGSTAELVARVSDHDTPTVGVSFVTVSFFADGAFLGTATTDTSGVARLVLPRRYLAPRHSYDAVFEGSEYYEASAGSINT